MYQINKLYVRPELKLSDLLLENPNLLLMMEHFSLNSIVQEMSVDQFCRKNDLRTGVFIAIANLYNGFQNTGKDLFTEKDIEVIIGFLSNCHRYYKQEKYPEIKSLIAQLYQTNTTAEVKLVEQFFNDYFEEVLEHLSYEESIAFPYFRNLSQNKSEALTESHFSVLEYGDHHSDIESTLSDLKNLILKHIPIQTDFVVRRKLLLSLCELEFDLKIHQSIEELILMPLIAKLEKKLSRE